MQKKFYFRWSFFLFVMPATVTMPVWAAQLEVIAQAQTAQLQNQAAVAVQQEQAEQALTETAVVVAGSIVVAAIVSSGWPIAFGALYGIRYLICRDSDGQPIVVPVPIQQEQAQQAQAHAQVTIIQKADQRKVLVSLRELTRGSRCLREELCRDMEHIDHRLDHVDQGQAELLRGQRQLGEGQAEVLNRVNYVARLIEQQCQPDLNQPQ